MLERPRLSQYNGGMAPRRGERAPDFTLTSTTGERIMLSSYRGRPVVLVFLRWLG